MDDGTKVKLVLMGLAVGGVVWFATQGVQGIARSAFSNAIGLGVGAAEGVVLGVGDAVGVPRTNKTACEQAKSEGRTWDASFDCEATDFVRYLFS
jgi:hypothetical protein